MKLSTLRTYAKRSGGTNMNKSNKDKVIRFLKNFEAQKVMYPTQNIGFFHITVLSQYCNSN